MINIVTDASNNITTNTTVHRKTLPINQCFRIGTHALSSRIYFEQNRHSTWLTI